MNYALGVPVFAISAAILCASCNVDPPPPGVPLTDGCYYAEGKAVLRIRANRGEVLIGGDVRRFTVSRNRTPDVTQAIFSPGFVLVPGPPLEAKLDPRFPKAYYMMAPGKEPAIMVPTSSRPPMPMILRLGDPC